MLGKGSAPSYLPFLLILLVALAGLPVARVASSSVQQISSRIKPTSVEDQSIEISGILSILYADGRDNLAGGVYYSISLTNGTTLPVTFTCNRTYFIYFGKQVTLTGRFSQVPLQASQKEPLTSVRPVFIADAIFSGQVGNVTEGAVLAPFAAIGTKRIVVLLLKFSDDTDVPHSPNFYNDLINAASPPVGSPLPATVNQFYISNSWNQFRWAADVGGIGGVPATGWITLPHPRSYYCPAGYLACANLGWITNDGTAAGVAQGIYFPQYDGIEFILSNDLGCCAYGGGTGTLNLNGVPKSYSATWEPPWSQEAETYSHELGHALGLPHSGWVYYYYDSPWDVMSAHNRPVSVVCGSYPYTLYCAEPGANIIATYKDLLGWIDNSHKVTLSPGQSTVTFLDGLALPLGSANKMVKICLSGYQCSGGTARYLTVEARIDSGTITGDRGIPGEGAIIHFYQADRTQPSGNCWGDFANQFGPAYPIDSTPGDWDSVNCNSGGRSYPNYALYNAQWGPGQTYTDSANGVTISIASRSGSTFSIAVGSPHVNTDKTTYAQGEYIQFSGTGFTPGGTVLGCLTIDNDNSFICGSPGTYADGQGKVNAGTMQVGTNIPIGPQKFVARDVSSGLDSNVVQLTITSPVTVTVTNTVTSTVSSTSYITRYTTTTVTSYTSTSTSTSTIPTLTTVVLVPLTVTSTAQGTQFLTSFLATTVTSYTGTTTSTSTIPTTVALLPLTVTSTAQSTQYLTSTLTTTVTTYTSTETSTSTIPTLTTVVLIPSTVTSTVQSTQYLSSTFTTTVTSYTDTTTSTSTSLVYTTVTVNPTGAGGGASSPLTILGFIPLLAITVGRIVTAGKGRRIPRVRSLTKRRCSTN